MSPAPLTLAAAREAAAKKYLRYAGTWAIGGPDALPVSIGLHPPTEAVALGDIPGTARWARSWESVEGVQWAVRRFASAGTQRVPERLVLPRAQDVAAFIGKARHWAELKRRAEALLTLSGADAPTEFGTAVAATAVAWIQLDTADFGRLHAVLLWLSRNPASGLYLRQLPIRGVDTKWIGRHQRLVTRLHAALTGSPGLGLASAPEMIRMRFLDQRLAPGGLGDVSAPLPEFSLLELEPARILVFENLQSVLAVPASPGTVVIHGSGYAVDRLAAIPWVRRRGVTYWGDLDSHGFAILNRLRAQDIEVATVLMDVKTLDEFADLCVIEPTPARGSMSHLLPAENSVMQVLAERGNLRLEQERIAWNYALAKLGISDPYPEGSG